MQKIVFFGVLAVALLCFMQTNAKALNSDEESDAFRHHGNDDNMPRPPFNGKLLTTYFITNKTNCF